MALFPARHQKKISKCNANNRQKNQELKQMRFSHAKVFDAQILTPSRSKIGILKVSILNKITIQKKLKTPYSETSKSEINAQFRSQIKLQT